MLNSIMVIILLVFRDKYTIRNSNYKNDFNY